MTDFLVKHFVKDNERTELPAVRQAYGRLAGLTGILLNLLLSVWKLIAGVLTGSISITADAFNNLSDAGSSVVTLLGFQLAGKKADDDHPFGHGRIEYLSGLFVAVLVLLVGVELFKSSVDKILHPGPVDFSWASVAILLLSIAVKVWMCLFNRKLAGRVNSTAMAATATDSLSDAAATATVLLGLLAGHFLDLKIDGWVGLVVSVFVLRAGWGAVKDTVDPLLGKPADPELVRAIQRTVLSRPELLSVHDLVLHDYGPGRRMMSLHAEVPADCDIITVHDVIDNVEREIKSAYGIEAVIHMDPIRQDEDTNQMRVRVIEMLHDINPELSMHDFRMTAGPSHTNLIFDVVAPYQFPLDDGQLRQAIRERVAAFQGGTYYAVVEIDHSF